MIDSDYEFRLQEEVFSLRDEIERLKAESDISDGLLADAKAEIDRKIERLRALALKFLDEQTDENAAALRAALVPKP